jgi:hypothetical protein
MIRKPELDYGNNQQIGTFLLNRACSMIAKKKFSAAYEFILDAYEYIICDDQDELWTIFPVKGEGSDTLQLRASFASYETSFSPRKPNIIDGLFDTQSSKLCLEYEYDFVRAFCHTVVKSPSYMGEGNFILEDGVAAINRYLKRFPKSEAALYLKAKLIYESSLGIETKEAEALSLINSALALRKSPKSLLLKARILESQQERIKNVNYQNDEPVLIMLDICTSHFSCLAAWRLLQQYGYIHRGITLPNPNSNRLILWFDDEEDKGYFVRDIDGILKSSFQEPNLRSKLFFTEEPKYESTDTTEEKGKLKELISTLITNRHLFTNNSYKVHIEEHNRNLTIAQERFQAELRSYSEQHEYDTENDYYNEDLDMDQQSQEYWDNL